MKEIVIRMSDGMFERILKAQSVPDMYGTDIVNAMNCIKSGTVLPEGHGDLIDRDYFTDKYAGCGSVYCEAISCEDCNSRIVNKLDVDNAPAVIPAARITESPETMGDL